MRADDVRAGRDSGEDAFVAGEATRHLDRLAIFDWLDVVDPARVPVRHHRPCPTLDQERAGRASADGRRRRRFMSLDEDAVGLERLRDAHERACRAHALAERRHLSLGLLPDLATEMVTVVGDDVRVVELVGGVMPRPRSELGRPGDHVVDVLGRDLGRSFH